MDNLQLEQLRSPEIRERIQAGWTSVIVACGAVEQHGPHLPLFTDAEVGTASAIEIARRLGHTLVAPTIRIGCSEHHMEFAGTITVRRETFEAVVTDYVTSLARHGFQRIFLLPAHGGNFGPLAAMEERLRQAVAPTLVVAYTDVFSVVDLWRRETEAELGLGASVGGHADIAETSVMRHLHESLVRMDLAERGFMGAMSEEVVARLMREGMRSMSPNGIFGDAHGATSALGQRLLNAVADHVADVFRRAGSAQPAPSGT
ncbi:MAG TPA: creatininase family protein [Candidatus Eisenbacteria bacterium]|nr:creatininase family protein [Candidatus Eisenbacteria bacterium]